MGKYSKEDYEFERNKQAILELRKQKAPVKEQNGSVWEFELNEYRRRKKQDRFLVFGAVCGILGFCMSGFLLLNTFYHYVG